MYDIHPLEPRTLFAAAPPAGATLVDGVLTVRCVANRSNSVTVSTVDANTVNVLFNGTNTTFPLADITRIDVNGGKKNDKVVIIEANGELNTGIRIMSGNGADNITGDVTPIKVVAGAGNDRVTGSQGDDTIAGESGNDSVRCGAGNDYVQAGSGNDTVYGEDGYDTLYGNDGNDRLSDDNSDDKENDFYGGSGDDRFYIGHDDRIYGYSFFEDVYIDGQKDHHHHHHDHDDDDFPFPF